MHTAPELHVVIHVLSSAQAVEQCRVVVDHGVGSVFLIDHRPQSSRLLFDAVAAVQGDVTGLRVGVNLLHGDPVAAAAEVAAAVAAGRVDALDAFWCDDVTGGWDGLEVPAALAEQFRTAPELAPTDCFGGVAFKYTPRYTDDPAAAALEASMFAGYVDVVTTSGPGTNRSASIDKVAAVAAAVPDGIRVALASGVDAGNVAGFAPWCTDVLVASSLETEPYSGQLVPERLAELRAALDALG
jgi:predicted TIM-barrel enzyme